MENPGPDSSTTVLANKQIDRFNNGDWLQFEVTKREESLEVLVDGKTVYQHQGRVFDHGFLSFRSWDKVAAGKVDDVKIYSLESKFSSSAAGSVREADFVTYGTSLLFQPAELDVGSKIFFTTHDDEEDHPLGFTAAKEGRSNGEVSAGGPRAGPFAEASIPASQPSAPRSQTAKASFNKQVTVVEIQDVAVKAGQTVTVPIELDTKESTAGLSGSIEYNPEALRFERAQPGRESSKVIVLVNEKDSSRGRVGIAVAQLPVKRGEAKDIVLLDLHFQSLAEGDEPVSSIRFVGQPVSKAVINQGAERVLAHFTEGSVTTHTKAPGLYVREFDEGTLEIQVIGAAEAKTVLEKSPDLEDWQRVKEVVLSDKGKATLNRSLNGQNARRFYRLRKLSENVSDR